MTWCKDCGNNLPEDSTFCWRCGSKNIKKTKNQDFGTKRKVFKECLNCGKELPEDSQFCQYCGSNNIHVFEEQIKIVKICKVCGKELPDDSRFCRFCGSDKIEEKECVEKKQATLTQDNNYLPNVSNSNEKTAYSNELNTNNAYNSGSNYYAKNKRPSKKNDLGGYVFLIIGFFLVLFIVGNCSSNMSTNYNSSNTSGSNNNSLSDPDANLTPQSVYNGQVLIAPWDDPITHVKVKTDSSNNYYVYLKDKTKNSKNDTAVYIKGGNTVTIEVPAGKYELYYCAGDTWYGKKDKFGSKTRFSKFEDLLDCTVKNDTVYNYEVTLYAVSGGNASTESIDESEFPD